MPAARLVDTPYNLRVVSNDVEAIRARAGDLARTYEDFKAALVEMRERHGLTQAQVGERLGISQEAVSKFESYDSNPTLASIRRYALAIDARLRLEVIDDATPDTPSTTATGRWAPAPAASRPRSRSGWSTRHSAASGSWRATSPQGTTYRG
jgi:transcriptional regulator with XRE-family HTH domain